LLHRLKPDVIVMAEITWYILPELAAVLRNLQKEAQSRDQPLYLIHMLATYSPGEQGYGTEFFTTHDEILEYFQLKYLEAASFFRPSNSPTVNPSYGSFFVAELR